MRVYPNPEKLIDGEPVKVYDPERRSYLPAEGRHVPRNTYWIRVLAQRDVCEGMPPVQADGIQVGAANSHPTEGEKKLTRAARRAAAKAAKAAAKMDTPEAAAATLENADLENSDGDKSASLQQDTANSPNATAPDAAAAGDATKSEG